LHDNFLVTLLGASLNQAPVLIVCIVSLVALFRSKIVPPSSLKIAAAGFLCLLVNAGIAIGFFASFLILRETTASTVLPALKLGMVASNLILTTLGLALISRAIFAGRKSATYPIIQEGRAKARPLI
jgi:hypothetical protein